MSKILDAIAKRSSASFANFIYKSKETGEVARYSVILGATIESLYEKDIKKLERIQRLLERINAQPHVLLAAAELIASRKESLEKGIGNNSRYSNADSYDHVPGIKGVKQHRETGAYHVSGLLNSKVIIKEGAPRKERNSAPKTIAKNKIGYMLPSGRYRQFALTNVTRAAVNGDVIELELGSLD